MFLVTVWHAATTFISLPLRSLNPLPSPALGVTRALYLCYLTHSLCHLSSSPNPSTASPVPASPALSVTWDVPLDYSALGRMTQIEALVGGGAGGRYSCSVHYRGLGGAVARSMEISFTAHRWWPSLGRTLRHLRLAPLRRSCCYWAWEGATVWTPARAHMADVVESDTWCPCVLLFSSLLPQELLFQGQGGMDDAGQPLYRASMPHLCRLGRLGELCMKWVKGWRKGGADGGRAMGGSMPRNVLRGRWRRPPGGAVHEVVLGGRADGRVVRAVRWCGMGWCWVGWCRVRWCGVGHVPAGGLGVSRDAHA